MNTEGKKYGLQLRAPIPPKKSPRAALPMAFQNNDDENDVEEEIARHASKKKSNKDVEQQHKQALEQDPTVFDYDCVYDEMKNKRARPLEHDRSKRESKYIGKLMEKAKARQQEQEIIHERILAKERSKEDELYGNKEKFVTNAYKKKLAEREKWVEEERLRELREEAHYVSKKNDMSDFYRNLLQINVAFGANSTKKDAPAAMISKYRGNSELKSENSGSCVSWSKQDGCMFHGKQNYGHKDLGKSMSEADEDRDTVKSNSILETCTAYNHLAGMTSASSNNREDGKPVTVNKAVKNSDKCDHKPSEEALAAAKLRYLSRKRMRQE
eukprot:Gb_11153 [translate_table: standard]